MTWSKQKIVIWVTTASHKLCTFSESVFFLDTLQIDFAPVLLWIKLFCLVFHEGIPSARLCRLLNQYFRVFLIKSLLGTHHDGFLAFS